MGNRQEGRNKDGIKKNVQKLGRKYKRHQMEGRRRQAGKKSGRNNQKKSGKREFKGKREKVRQRQEVGLD